MSIFKVSSVSIDVSLFAVLLALNFTGKNRTLKMAVLLVLMGHVLLTTNNVPLPTTPNDDIEALGNMGEDAPRVDASDGAEVSSHADGEERAGPGADSAVSVPQNEPTNTIEAADLPRVQKNVSNSEFDRQFSIPPEYSRTDGILPRTSEAANSKLARSRTTFFDNILHS